MSPLQKIIIRGRSHCPESWWKDAPREGFTARAWQEWPRMNASPFADIKPSGGGKYTSTPRLEDVLG